MHIVMIRAPEIFSFWKKRRYFTKKPVRWLWVLLVSLQWQLTLVLLHYVTSPSHTIIHFKLCIQPVYLIFCFIYLILVACFYLHSVQNFHSVDWSLVTLCVSQWLRKYGGDLKNRCRWTSGPKPASFTQTHARKRTCTHSNNHSWQ